MGRRFQWRALFVALVAVLAVWMYVRERVDTRPLRNPEFGQPNPPALAPIALGAGPLALAGRVITSAGAALSDASVVVLEAGMPIAARTATDGAFRVEGLTAGEHELTVLAFGEVPQTFRVALPRAEPLEIQLAPPSPPVDVLPELVRGDLRGRLRGDATRFDGLELWLEPAPATAALTGVVPRRARVAEDGSFAFDALAAGAYAARVLPAWASGGSWPIVASLDFGWSGSGDALEIDYRPAQATLRALDIAGRVLPGAVVTLRERANPGHVWPARATDAAGEARFDDLPAGGYEIEVRAGATRNQAPLELSLAAGERVDLGNVVLVR